jgi:glyoxylase-like metal-dependent hydrolase (beta-lactamase superfamily II)
MSRTELSRRSFLLHTAIGAGALAARTPEGLFATPPEGDPGLGSAPGGAGAKPAPWTRLSEHLLVDRGPIHVGIVRWGRRGLLVDCGNENLPQTLRGLGIDTVDQVLFTHHHRDQACQAWALAAAGAKIAVPAGERPYFDDVSAYWNNPQHRWHLYNLHPHHLMLAEPVRVDAELAGGQAFRWGPARITVLATPGHTDGSVSYLLEIDGRRVVFCGDAIYDAGQLWEIHSLQKGTETTDYHGFLGARAQLAASLGRIKQLGADLVVPSHGKIMADPGAAIDLVVRRLEACYDKYVAISALRHYFPRMFAAYVGRKGHMPIRPGKPVPDCLRHVGTSWVLVSRDKTALVMDCGAPQVVATLRGWLARREIAAIEGLWVTHYHDDHVDAIPEFQRAFDCPTITDSHVAEVITDPLAWRLPCISPHRAKVDRPTRDGDSWTWREFRLTAYHLPGQTLYHAGLLVEGSGLRMLFVGDSFTMAGIDDYCSSNRNWLGRDVGFDRCVALIARLRPTHIFNCHVPVAFDFTPEECRFMRQNLAQREALFGELFPWDHPNYGIDEPWVRCHPYEQRMAPGGEASIRVVITNHSPQSHAAACRAVLPRCWPRAAGGEKRTAAGDSQQTSAWASTTVPGKQEGSVRLSFRLPGDTPPGRRYVIPVDLRYGSWDLPQITEAVVVT